MSPSNLVFGQRLTIMIYVIIGQTNSKINFHKKKKQFEFSIHLEENSKLINVTSILLRKKKTPKKEILLAFVLDIYYFSFGFT